VECLEDRVLPAITVSLTDLGGLSELLLTGPTGSSLEIDGNWQDNPDGNHLHVYTASGDLTLKSAAADLPFTEDDSTPITISTASDSDQLAGVNWSGPALSTDLDALAGFHNTFGVTLQAPSAQWNVQQGSDLVANGLPVDPNMPFITFSEPDGSYTAQFGSITGSGDLSVAFAPQDPALLLENTGLTFGGSFGGNFTLQPVSGLPGSVDPVSGHLYGVGNVDLGQNNLTLQNAAMVVNLDAQQDGALLGSLSGDTASQLFTGAIPLSSFGGDNQADVAAGYNGQTTLTYNVLGFDLPLTVNSSSGEYSNGTVTVHGVQDISLFGQTPFSFINGDNVDVAATFDSNGLHGIQLSVSNASFGSVAVSNATVNLTQDSVSLAGTLQGLLGSGNVSLTGSVSSDGTWSVQGTAGDLTVGPVTLHNASVNLDSNGVSLSANADVPLVGSVSLTGSWTDDNTYSLTGHVDSVTIGGFTFSNDDVTLSNSGLTFAGDVTLPGAGTVTVTGSIQDASTYSFSAHIDSLTIGGFVFTNDDVTVSNDGVTFAGDATLPLLNTVHLTGSIIDASNWSFTAHIDSVTIGGFTFSNDDVTLSNAGLTFAGDATLPLLNTVHLTGSITDASNYSFTAHINSATIGSVTFSNVDVTVSNSGLSFAGDATLPLLNTVHLTGTITDATHYSFTAHIGSATIGGFTFSNDDITLSNTGLTFAGDATLPLLNTVHLAGSITDASNYSFTAHINSATIGGFSISNADVTLSNSGLSFAGDATLPVVGSVHFAGSITDATHYSFTAHINSVTLGAFTLSNVDVTLSNSDLSLAGDATLALVGSVHLTGTITDATHYSFTAHITSVTIGGFTFSNDDITLSNAGLSFAGDVTVPLLSTVHVSGTITDATHYSFTAHINSATIGGFALTNDDITLSNSGLSFAGNATLPVVGTVHLSGSITDATHYTFTAHINSVTVGGFTLSNVDVTLSNSGVSFAGDASLALVGSVHLTGTITDATHYSFTAHINSVTIGGFTFSNDDITLSNAGLSFAGDATLPLLSTVHVSGSITDASHYSFTAHINSVTIGGFALSNDDITLSNSGLSFSGNATLPVVGSVHLSGSITDATHYTFTVHINSVMVGPLTSSNVDVTLSNSGVSFAGDATVALVGAVHLTGTITDATHYSFTAHISSLTIAGIGVQNADVTYSNTGLNFAGDATLPLLNTVHVSGSITDSTHYSFTAHINSVTIGGFGLTNSDVRYAQ
jgi:molybdenum-dependent DNA-binding transcriptional regulator ModE